MTTLEARTRRRVVVAMLSMAFVASASARSQIRRPDPCAELQLGTADEARSMPLGALFDRVGRLASCPQPLLATLLPWLDAAEARLRAAAPKGWRTSADYDAQQLGEEYTGMAELAGEMAAHVRWAGRSATDVAWLLQQLPRVHDGRGAWVMQALADTGDPRATAALRRRLTETNGMQDAASAQALKRLEERSAIVARGVHAVMSVAAGTDDEMARWAMERLRAWEPRDEMVRAAQLEASALHDRWLAISSLPRWDPAVRRFADRWCGVPERLSSLAPELRIETLPICGRLPVLPACKVAPGR